MKIQDTLKIKGRLHITGRDKDGKVVLKETVDNLITNAGFDFICDVIGKSSQPARMAYMAIGDGAVGDATKTALTSQKDRQAATYAHTAGTKKFTFTATFANVSGVKEYGMFNAASNGTMLNTASFGPATVDSLELEAEFTLS